MSLVSQAGTINLMVLETTSLIIGSAQTGDIEEARDIDVFSLSVTAGTTYTIDQKGFSHRLAPYETHYYIKRSDGNILAQNDDGGFRLESRFRILQQVLELFTSRLAHLARTRVLMRFLLAQVPAEVMWPTHLVLV